MITFTDILVFMLAYAGLSLGTICLIWHLRNARAEPRRQWMALKRIFQASFPGH